MKSKEQIDKQLHDLGWDYNENLRCYSNENRYVELADAPYIDIYTWCDGNKDASYLTIEEFILFSKLFEIKDLEVLEIFKKLLFIEIADKPCWNGKYSISLKENEDDNVDYTIIFVSKKEKDLLKEWLDK